MVIPSECKESLKSPLSLNRMTGSPVKWYGMMFTLLGQMHYFLSVVINKVSAFNSLQVELSVSVSVNLLQSIFVS